MQRAARFLSVLLHPLFMPVYTILLAFRMDPHLSFFLPAHLLALNYAMLVVMTILFPLLSTLLLLRAGSISDLHMPKRRERILPYGMTLFYYGLTYYMLLRSPHHPATYAMMVGAMVALFLTLVITLRWKISAHMVGIGGLLGTLTALTIMHRMHAPVEMAAMFLLAGALGTARMVSGAHGPAQVYAGAVLGFLSTFCCLLLLPGY